MENQSPTQEMLTNQRIQTKENILKSIKENINYIYIVIMIVANCLVSLLHVDEDGKLIFKYPQSGLGWALWIAQILTITFIGVMIMGAFRNQGIKNGHNMIEGTYKEYLNAISSQTKEINPRSLKEYQTSKKIADALTKGSMLILINLLAISATITANLNALFALIVNIIFSISFGIKALLEAEDYVITELVIWYKQQIARIKKIKERKDERH